MSDIVNIKEARARRNPDTMMNMAMNNPGLKKRRAERARAYYARNAEKDAEILYLRRRLAEADSLLAKVVVITAVVVAAAMLIGFLG